MCIKIWQIRIYREVKAIHYNHYNMSKTVIKFGSRDAIEFIEIYRKHECLWNTEHALYKNREARAAALKEFSKEFGVENFGLKEIKTKIKNLRSQYHAEKKKIKDSIETGCSISNVYTPKLAWYGLMDSFLLKTSEDKDIFSNSNENSLSTQDNTSLQYNEAISVNMDEVEEIKNFGAEILEVPNVSQVQTRKRPSVTNYIVQSASDPLHNTEKRVKIKTKDDLDSFGNYIIAALRTLNAKNCIHAQDEIQRVLSKYKLQNLHENKNSSIQNTTQYSSQSDEEQ